MQEQAQQGWTPFEDAKKAANILVFTAMAVASPVEVFLRTKFGSRYFGLAALGGLFVVPLWSLFWPDASPVGLWVFWGLYLVMQLRARIESARMGARGECVHTRYNGWPRLARLFRKMSEQRIKAGVEPLLVIVAGVCLMPVSQPLGSYLMIAGFALGVTHSVIESVERARALEINDALIEQQQTSERFRAMRNGQTR